MRFFLDSEFIEDGRTIDLISIGIVALNGKEFYRQNSQASFKTANEFVRDNVIPKLYKCPRGIDGPRHTYGLCGDANCVWRSRRQIAVELFEWVGVMSKPDGFRWEKPEFWGYYADYDWVVVCQLFGRMIDLPKGWPMHCNDIKQYADYLGGPKLPEEGKDEHNALSDARWNRHAWEYLSRFDRTLSQRERNEYFAGERNKQEVPAREVDQESGHVRSPEAAGQNEVGGGGDLERRDEQDGTTREASFRHVGVGKAALLDDQGSAFQ